jgi:hypothetical protein
MPFKSAAFCHFIKTDPIKFQSERCMKPEEVTLSRKQKIKIALRVIRSEASYVAQCAFRKIMNRLTIVFLIAYVISIQILRYTCAFDGARCYDSVFFSVFTYLVGAPILATLISTAVWLLYEFMRTTCEVIMATDLGIYSLRRYKQLCHEEKVKELEQVDITLLEDE